MLGLVRGYRNRTIPLSLTTTGSFIQTTATQAVRLPTLGLSPHSRWIRTHWEITKNLNQSKMLGKARDVGANQEVGGGQLGFLKRRQPQYTHQATLGTTTSRTSRRPRRVTYGLLARHFR